MKLDSKIQLEKKFNTIPNIAVGSLLRFNSSNELEAVSPGNEGIMPQIKVYAPTNATVSCTKSSGGALTPIRYPSGGNTWYFNTSGIGSYTATVNSVNYSVNVAEYKQYIVNAMS